MDGAANDIVSELRQSILSLSGYKQINGDGISTGFAPVDRAFPNHTFPTGAVHEFLTSSIEDVASTNGFIGVLLNKLMQFDGAAVWISASRTLFPASLVRFGVSPHKIIFVDLINEKDVLYAMEECLKCKRIAAVVGEIKHITFKESRRLQLAAEYSRVTGLLVHNPSKFAHTIASIASWRITSLPRELPGGMPGIGFPRWQVQLLKVRNGKPGTWNLEYFSNQLKEIKENIFSISQEQRRKAG